MLKVKHHIISAFPLGMILFIASKDIITTSIACLSTIIIDIDHWFDYAINTRSFGTIKNISVTYRDGLVDKTFFILHSWELVLLVLFYSINNPNQFIIGGLIGGVYHLTLDQIYNCNFNGEFNVKNSFYFISFRFFYGFIYKDLRKT